MRAWPWHVARRKNTDARHKSALTLRAISLERDLAILIDIAQTYLQLAKQQDAEQPQPDTQQQQQVQPKDDVKKE
jgi:hypothetical protein